MIKLYSLAFPVVLAFLSVEFTATAIPISNPEIELGWTTSGHALHSAEKILKAGHIRYSFGQDVYYQIWIQKSDLRRASEQLERYFKNHPDEDQLELNYKEINQLNAE
jgi:hypothetical protein